MEWLAHLPLVGGGGVSVWYQSQLVVRVLPIAIRVPLRMGSSSHRGERKGQLGPGVTVPMIGLPPKGYPEGSRRVWTPQYKGAFYCGFHNLHDPSGYPSGGSPLIGTVTPGPNRPFLSPS